MAENRGVKSSNLMLTHEMMITSVCLAFVGGYLDAFTYLTKGGVFANAQTGNIVLMGIYAAERNFSSVLHCLVPITAFIVGVLISELLKRKTSNVKWQRIILLLELLILAAIALLGVHMPDFAVNAVISFVCSLQVNSFRTTNGLAFATTMCTGNLRSATEKLAAFFETRDFSALRQSLRYFAVIFVFVLGAAAGAVISPILNNGSVLISAVLLLIVFVYDLIFEKLNNKKTNNRLQV